MNTEKTNKFLIYNPSQIVQVVSSGEDFVRGSSNLTTDNLAILNSKENDPLVLVSIDGIISFVGYESNELYKEKYKSLKYDSTINASGCCVLPGLIDSHTHPIWQGDRINEFKMKLFKISKLEGATYMDIHKAGGGINFSVEETKKATEDKLYESLVKRLTNFSKTGTTFVECKSGYGLEWETEYKLLRVLTKAKRELKSIGISNTYLGGHAVPKGKSSEQATDDIVNTQLPLLSDLLKSKELDVDNVDVFCEKGVFDVKQTESICKKAQLLSNLNVNIHSDELFPLNSVEMAIQINAKAVSHLEEISENEIALLSKSNTVGVLLPTTAIILQLKRPPARQMLNAGCIIALGSDFNPNAYCYSMPLIMSLACIDLRLTMNEALIAATINSAYALGIQRKHGSIEVGKQADFVIAKSNRWENLIYQIGAHDSLISYVIVNGQKVHESN